MVVVLSAFECSLRKSVKSLSKSTSHSKVFLILRSQKLDLKPIDRLDQKHTEDAKLRLTSHRLYQPSRSPLSSVLGISVGLVSRHHENGGFRHELVVNVAGADRSVNKAGSFSRQTKSITTYDYEWFVKAWRKACKDKAGISGLRRTPSRWYQSVPSEKEVQKFIKDKVASKLKAA